MDRSYLSHAGVVAESRKFVCVRLQTYENSAERSLLKTIFVGRSRELENTTFSIMNPDGTRNLVHNAAFEEGTGINTLTSADPGPPIGGAVFHDTAVWLAPVGGSIRLNTGTGSERAKALSES